VTAASSWAPTAARATLERRAQLLARVREFFGVRAALEVDTPALVRHAVTDPHIHSAQVQLPGSAQPLFLQTSPEYAMKRLLAAGSGDIFQIAHVFRGEERSRLHNAEFTLIEWYRGGWPMRALMHEVAELTQLLLGPAAPSAPAQFLDYELAFAHAVGLNPLQAGDAKLRRCAQSHGLEASLVQRCSRDELLDWLMATRIGPKLGSQALTFIHRYPASQAALARLDPDDRRVALRFELYYQGIELANGFEELTNADEQRARFEIDRRERARLGLYVPEVDEALLAALAAGMPPVAGVALGFDRVLMLHLGVGRIDEVLAFPLERA
jgi:lysyl-tRNA synthetase class 2